MPKSRGMAIFDIGKSNLKLTVSLGDESRFEELAAAPNLVSAGPPYPHFDAERIWNWLMDALADAANRFDITAIIPVTHGATAAIMRGSELALPILDYEFAGPDIDGRAYDSLRPPFASTLSPQLPLGLNLGRQIWWQSTHFAAAFVKADHILLYPQYWSWRLSGVAASEVTSIGCHTDLWRPVERLPSSLVEDQRWTSLLPPFRKAGEMLGVIRPEAAKRTGLAPAVRILNGIHDSNASYVRHLSHYGERPFSVLSTGTWVVAMGGSRPLFQLDETQDCLANVDVNGTPVPCARFMGGREFEAILGGRPIPEATEVEIDSTIRHLMATHRYALPSFAPSGGPFSSRRGTLTGTPIESDLELACVAAMYLALVSDYCLNLVGSTGDVHVEGKLGGNPVYLRALAALRSPQPVFVTDDATGTARGAALLAAQSPAGIANALRAVLPGPVLFGEYPGLQRFAQTWREQAVNR